MLLKEPPPIKSAKTRSVISDRAQDATMRQIRREAAQKSLPFFCSYYMRDDNSEKLRFKEFHIEMMEAYADANNGRVLALEPASFGKSSLLKFYMIWLMIVNPNIRIALIGKTFDDATKRLRTIKAELEGNHDLIEDFGPFKGDVWKEDQITVAARTSNAKEANISCAGGESNIMGWRSDVVVLDDIVTNDNSGPQVRPESRERLKDNFNQGVLKLGVVGEVSLIRWVNTVVDKRDLTHEVGRLKDHPDMADTRWTTPEGWLVLRRSAYNETTGELLWPEKYPMNRPPLVDGRPDPRPSVERDMLTDPLMFQKRMQNRCLEQGLLPFQQVYIDGNHAEYPGCLDTSRHLRDVPSGWITAGGFDPSGSVGATSDWAGHIVVAFEKTNEDSRIYQVVWIDRGRWELETQQQHVVDEHRFFNSAKTKVESNAAQQWFVSSGIVKKMATDPKATVHGPMRIEPVYTTDEKFHKDRSKSYGKPDPDFGIPSLAGLVKAGRIRFPTGDAISLERSQWLIGEMLEYPMGHSGDLLMALWFAILAARESEASSIRVIHRPLPQWAAFGRVN